MKMFLTPNKLMMCMVLFLISCNEERSKIKVSSGTIDVISQFSSQFVPPRDVVIWKPDQFHPDSSYQVMYMNDGQALFDSTITWNKQEWKVDETLSALMNRNEIAPTIAVGIYNGGKGRHTEYFPQKPFEQLAQTIQDSFQNKGNEESHFYLEHPVSDHYLKFLVEELMPYIDQNYPTSGKNYIGGSSMGGLISWYAVCEYPNSFEGAACISTHWPGNYPIENNPIPEQFYGYLKENLPTNKMFYFDYGTKTLDSFYPPLQKEVDSIMINKGFDSTQWVTKEFKGEDHSENAWNKRLHIPFKFLLKD